MEGEWSKNIKKKGRQKTTETERAKERDRRGHVVCQQSVSVNPPCHLVCPSASWSVAIRVGKIECRNNVLMQTSLQHCSACQTQLFLFCKSCIYIRWHQRQAKTLYNTSLTPRSTHVTWSPGNMGLWIALWKIKQISATWITQENCIKHWNHNLSVTVIKLLSHQCDTRQHLKQGNKVMPIP